MNDDQEFSFSCISYMILFSSFHSESGTEHTLYKITSYLSSYMKIPSVTFSQEGFQPI